MTDVNASWIFVGGHRTFQRIELYGPNALPRVISGSDCIVPAPFGGPILVIKDSNVVHVHQASGQEISSWRWKNAKIVSCGWSNQEESVFAVEDGSVFVYDVFGNFVKVFSMGSEAKDLKVKEARIFRGKMSTGVAVVTTSRRFFVVNNIQEPRVRRMADVDYQTPPDQRLAWSVLTDQRQARIVVARSPSSVVILEQSEAVVVDMSGGLSAAAQQGDEGGNSQIVAVSVSHDSERLAVLSKSGLLWLGGVDRNMSTSVRLLDSGDEMALSLLPEHLIWCAPDALLLFTPESSQCKIIALSADGGKCESEDTFLPDYVASVQELDGVRVFSLSSQELFQEVPRALLDTFDLRCSADSPSAGLRYAAEEFSRKSHKADDYMRQISRDLDIAVDTCIESAAYVWAPLLQKELLRAAQFGKSFLSGSSSSSAEKFTKMCITLRILNALRDFRVGIPLTIKQYDFLTPRVVIDRLLSRRLYPLALKICQLLNLPLGEGESRVLAHWACYKVGTASSTDDSATAKAISSRLGHHPHLSYSDIASKAADCGKKELAIKLLEHEVRVSRQVPLLVQLGRESDALVRALGSGNRDLAFSVILHLRAELSSSDFHFMIRKFPLGKVLYESYCRQNAESGDSSEALEDWLVQEDDFSALARHNFRLCYEESTRYESRTTRLHNVQEMWQKAKQEPFQAMAEENLKLMRHQSSLEEKLAQSGKSFLGLTANETICELLIADQLKLAEKLKSDLRVSDRRFAWLKARAMVRRRQWLELRKFVRQKKQPLSVVQVVRLVKQMSGEAEAKTFWAAAATDEPAGPTTGGGATSEKIDLYTELGMFLEAANAAFMARSVESLTALESVCAGKSEEALRAISGFKAKLLAK